MPRPVRFDSDHIAAFAALSHDRNPLHVAGEYARATPYGEPLVHGVLAALPLLAGRPGPGHLVRRITLSFVRPVFAGRGYTVEHAPAATGHTARLTDAGGPVVKAVTEFGPGVLSLDDAPARPVPVGIRARDLDFAELRQAQEESGHYTAGDGVAEVMSRHGLGDAGLGPGDLELLLWASYHTGMRTPGRQALLSKVTLTLPAARPRAATGLRYRAVIDRLDPRVHLVQTRAVLHRNGADTADTADVVIRAFWRPPTPRLTLADVSAALSGVPRPPGHAAVVIGASRGIGAALTLGLAHLGFHVTGCYRTSRTRAAEVEQAAAGAAGEVRMVQGDAANADWCVRVAADVERRHGGLGLLACVAAPPLQPVRLTGPAVPLVTDFVARSVALVAAPFSAFLPLAARAGGQAVVVSSAALADLPPDWPHYAAAKGAVEGLVAGAIPAHPRVTFHIVRLPLVATEYITRLNAAPQALTSAQAAAGIIRRLTGLADRPTPSGTQAETKAVPGSRREAVHEP